VKTFKPVALWIIRIGLYIVPFIPLFVSRTLFFPYITGKAFTFRIIVEVACALWVALALFDAEYRPKKTALLYAVSAFVGVLILATVFAADPYRALWSNFERMEGLIAHLHLFVYFLMLSTVFKKREWKIFWNLFVVSGLGQVGYVFLQKLGYLASPQGGFRTDGTIGNPTYVAAYLIFVLAAQALLWIGTSKKILRYFYLGTFVLTLLAIYFTATRGVMLALFVVAVLGALLYLYFVRPTTTGGKQRRMWIAIGLAVLVLAAVGIKVGKNTSFVQGSEILSRFSSISIAEGKSRFLIWPIGWDGFKERLILGWGPENYNIVFAKYYNPNLYTQEPWFDRSHNFVLDWLVSAGVLGLLAYLVMFFAAIKLLWKPYRKMHHEQVHDRRTAFEIALVLSFLFFVYILQNLLVFDQLATYIGIFAVFAYIQSRVGEDHTVKSVGGDIPVWKTLTAGAIGVVMIPIFYFVNYKPMAANLSLLSAFQIRTASEIPTALAAYDKALSYNTFGSREIREQLSQFTVAALNSTAVDNGIKGEIFIKAVEELTKGTKEYPLDPRVFLFLGVAKSAGGDYDGAITTFEEALKLSPKKQQILFELADTYIKKSDFRNAESTLKEAFDLAPGFHQARVSLAAAYILNNKQNQADALLVEGFGTVNVPEQVLAQVYAVRKDYPRLLAIWQAFLETNHQNLDYWKNVAAVYLELGKYSDAIKTLENAIAENPSFKAEGESYITQIKSGM